MIFLILDLGVIWLDNALSIKGYIILNEIQIINRGFIYLQACGMLDEEALILAKNTALMIKENKKELLVNDFMNEIIILGENLLPKLKARPMSLGHMVAAEFE